MVSRLLYLEAGQLRRAWPFFVLYLGLFAALTLADGLSLAMFVARVGADHVPRLQACSAAFVMLAVGWYLRAARRCRGDRVFVGILLGPALLFGLVGVGLSCRMLDARCLGVLFLGREILFALVLLHFGAYLQEYFLRSELNRVMPVIYAGGRVGGIAGAAALEHLSQQFEPAQLLLLLAALLAASILGVTLIHRFATVVDEPDEAAANATLPTEPTSPPRRARESIDSDVAQTESLRGFLTFVWKSPLLFWITLSTVAFFFCRAGLALQCSLCFEREFADDAALAQFLGRYAQIALAVSLVFQLLVVSRLVAWIGLRGAQLTYAAIVAGAAFGGGGEMSLAAAVAARFVEGELRYGLRNPLAQMSLNLFAKRVRTKVRGWSLGVLIPATTLAASLGFDVLVRRGAIGGIALVTIAAALAYLAASFGFARSIAEPRQPPCATPQQPPFAQFASGLHRPRQTPHVHA